MKKKSKPVKKTPSKAKAKLKVVGSKLEKGLRKAVTKVSDVPFAPLLPFKKLMVDALDKRGIKHTSDLSDITPKFYHNIIKNNFQTPNESYFADGNELVLTEHVDGKKVVGSVAKTGTGGGAINVAAKFATGDVVGGASALVTEVLTYLRKLKDRKDKQEQEKAAGGIVSDPLTPEEEKILANAQNTTKQLQAVAKDEAENTVAAQVKEFIFSWKGGVALLVLVMLLVAVARKK